MSTCNVNGHPKNNSKNYYSCTRTHVLSGKLLKLIICIWGKSAPAHAHARVHAHLHTHFQTSPRRLPETGELPKQHPSVAPAPRWCPFHRRQRDLKGHFHSFSLQQGRNLICPQLSIAWGVFGVPEWLLSPSLPEPLSLTFTVTTPTQHFPLNVKWLCCWWRPVQYPPDHKVNPDNPNCIRSLIGWSHLLKKNKKKTAEIILMSNKSVYCGALKPF